MAMQMGANKLVNTCTRTKSGETVLIVTEAAKVPIAEAIATATLAQEAEPIVMVMQPRHRAGQEPPVSVAEAMQAADVVFVPVSYSITHTHAVKNAANAGARIIVMTDFSEEMMDHGGLEADFETLKPICLGVADKFDQGCRIQLTSQVGTNISMDIAGRPGNALYCMVEPGQFSTVPTVEANVSPVEGSAQGRIVVDASIPYLGIGIIKEPIIVDVQDGMITSIDGGRQAKILKEDLAGHDDPTVYNIAELGVGLNPHCRMCGIMLEDEGVMSTCHIGIGTSITLGGQVKAPIHYDLIMWDPKVNVDGNVVIDCKEVFINNV